MLHVGVMVRVSQRRGVHVFLGGVQSDIHLMEMVKPFCAHENGMDPLEFVSVMVGVVVPILRYPV